jgi:hypothetical protein
MPSDDASNAQLVFLVACYALCGLWCGLLAIRGTRTWNALATRIVGGIVAALSVGYALFLVVVLIRQTGSLPIGFLGLVIPGVMILNAYRHVILGLDPPRRR